MFYRTLGRTGLRVSEVGFGSWAIGGTSYGATSDSESLAALQTAFEHGVNFFDTADIYGMGKSEELIAKLIKGRRPEFVVATKGGWDYSAGAGKQNYDPSYIRTAIEASLRRLGTDYIDLYQLHNPPDDLLENQNYKPLIGMLRAEQQKGKIRFIGISIYAARQGIRWIETEEPDVIQCIYNLIDQRVEKEFLPLAREKNTGVIVREPLQCGLLSGKYNALSAFPKNDHRRRWTREKIALDLKKAALFKEAFTDFAQNPIYFSLAFILSHPAVSTVIPGAKTVSQVLKNISAVEPKVSPDFFEGARKLYQEEEIFKTGFYRE
ncbi:MAG: aldo/keto reductase [Candidatus Omnitrophica bacterium]|nr:aldo/keto reductase [Candidatus Omnitrophota bacterium]